MPVPSNSSPAPRAVEDEPQTRTYLLVLVTEAIVIAVLYWIGAHFS